MQGSGGAWREALGQYVESTEGNLRSLRKESHKYYQVG